MYMADVSAAHVHIHLNVYPCGVRLFFSLSLLPSPFPLSLKELIFICIFGVLIFLSSCILSGKTRQVKKMNTQEDIKLVETVSIDV